MARTALCKRPVSEASKSTFIKAVDDSNSAKNVVYSHLWLHSIFTKTLATQGNKLHSQKVSNTLSNEKAQTEEGLDIRRLPEREL